MAAVELEGSVVGGVTGRGRVEAMVAGEAGEGEAEEVPVECVVLAINVDNSRETFFCFFSYCR